MLSIPGRIPIRIFPFFWLLAVIIGWVNSETLLGTFLWTIVIVISVLVHEFGHALTALAFGQEANIDLVGLGGLTQRKGPKLSLWKEFVIVLNGPLAGLLLCILAYFLLKLFGTQPLTPIIYLVEITFYANLFWTVVNLLPVQPLDGGKLLSIVLESIFGFRGIKMALFVSLLLSLAVSLLFFALQAFLAGALFLMLTFESYRAWQSSLPMTKSDQDQTLQETLKQAETEWRAGNGEKATLLLQEIRAKTSSGVIYETATELLAQIFHEQEHFQEAYELLLSVENLLTSDALHLLHQLAYRLGKWDKLISIGDQCYQNFPDYQTALLNAFGYAALSQERPAVGWLKCAIRDGLPHPAAILNKKEFDSIRNSPSFNELFSSLRS